MTLSEAGRKGGEAVLRKYGADFYAKIGGKGGERGGAARKRSLGHDGYVALGQKGGEAVVKRYGPEHMARIGRRGGERGGASRVAQSRAAAEAESPSSPGPSG